MGSTIDGAPPGSRPDPIEWRDLAATTPADAIRELLLPAPWLFGSLILAAQELYPLALTASFVFFLTGLRVVHGAFHYTLGLPRRATDFVMFTFSLVMLGSMHAVQWNPGGKSNPPANHLKKMSVLRVLRPPDCATRVATNAIQACPADAAIRFLHSAIRAAHSG